MRWPHCTIHTNTSQGAVAGIAPSVIAASRETDIPAFYADWFMARLREGYAVWVNPFRPSRREYVSFSQCRVFVLWTKNIAPMLPHLPELLERGFEFYVQYTLNDYMQEGLEPGLPRLEERIASFVELAQRYGPHRVIWRYDPVLFGAQLAPETVLERINTLGKRVCHHTHKLVFSFADIKRYTRVQQRLAGHALGFYEPDENQQLNFTRQLIRCCKGWPQPLRLATCAESPRLGLLGIEANRCIDPRLIYSLCPDMLRHYPDKADNQQRPGCLCSAAKDIGAYDTCFHSCIYCYAGAPKTQVQAATDRLHLQNCLYNFRT